MPNVILDKPHTHAGVLHAISDELKVLEHEAEWLIERGIAYLKGNLKGYRQSATVAPPLAADAPAPSDALTNPTEKTPTSGDDYV